MYEAKDERMAKYLAQVQSTMVYFESIMFEQISRLKNEQADALANLAFTLPRPTCNIFLKSLTISSIDTWLILNIEAETKPDSWVTPILKYLRIGEVSESRKETFKLRSQAALYCLIRNELYKRSFTGSYLKCLIEKEVQGVLSKLHEGT